MLKEVQAALSARREKLLTELRETASRFNGKFGRLDPHAIKYIQKELDEIDEELNDNGCK